MPGAINEEEDPEDKATTKMAEKLLGYIVLHDRFSLSRFLICGSVPTG
jgi:hypothetical protein